MSLEKRKTDECKKEMKIWLSVSAVSAILFTGLMIAAAVYDVRFKYGLYMVVLTCIVMYFSFVMYSFNQYISTREIVSILVRKFRDSWD